VRAALLAIVTVVCLLAAAAAAPAQRLSVNKNIANVRSGPNTKEDVIWQVEKYHPLMFVEKQGQWVYFEDFEGDHGWIHHTLLSETKTVIVKKDKCNIRSGPGTTSKILLTVDKGVPFKVLQSEGNWLQVVHADGDKGWIHRSLVW
jgi:SH3-like domain-containing protein